MHLKMSKSVSRTATRARPVTVNFPLPKKSISKLRSLAIGRDPRLLDLGVLAVQISDDESIVLGIELEKAKKKSNVYVNKGASSSFTHPPHGRVSFDTSSAGPPRFTTPFASPSNHNSEVYQHLPSARNDNFAAKAKKPAQSSAAKRRAKETLNAAKRGRGRGRAGKASVRTSTWEMVYTHIGLPKEHHNKALNVLEPPVGSQASGIAHVPVELPKESILKSESKRKSSVSSPPLKSPIGHNAVYSEDDSSVSSSPCSHSPMNSEELMNLFVDSNLSATSVLKQLAESCSKEGEKHTEGENNSDKNRTTNVEAGLNDQTQIQGPSSTVAGTAFDGSSQWGIFPKKSGTHLSKMDNSNKVSDTKTNKSASCLENGITISSLCGVGPNSSQINCSSSLTSSSNPLTANTTTSIKRPASSLGELYSTLSSTSSKPQSLSQSCNPQASKRPRRSFAELESKKEMGYIGKLDESNLQTSTDTLASPNVTQVPKQHNVSGLSSPNKQFGNILTSKPTSNMALRNYLQYGYYYSSEELNRALAKTASTSTSTKHETAPQSNGNTSVCTSSEVNLNSCENSNTDVSSLKLKSQDEKPALSDSTSGLSSTSSSLPIFSNDAHVSVQNSSPNNEVILETSTDISKTSLMNKSSTSVLELHRTSPSSSNEKSSPKSSQVDAKVPCPAPISCPMTSEDTTFSHTVSTSSNSKKFETAVVDSNGNSQNTGKCYAISYVYPMGTVWYPYVAITPYAVHKTSDTTEGSKTEKDKSETEGESSSCNSSSQYIDLASSLRYWQQLSLLYKNRMLVTGSANSNTTPATVSTFDQNTCTSTSAISNTVTSTKASDLSGQSLTASMVPKSERAKDSFNLSDLCNDVSVSKTSLASQDLSSNPDKKTVRRASVIVASKTATVVSSSKINSEESYQNRSSSSTPESEASSDGMPIKSEALVIDNCNRLIEEHCHRMNEVLADTPKNYNSGHTEMSKCNFPVTPSLSFIPDSSIAYVNVGNNNGSRKTAGNGRDGKSKSSKKKKTNKTV